MAGPTPEELRRQAEELDAKALDRMREARGLMAEAEFLRRTANERERLASLPAGNKRVTNEEMVTVERVRISEGRTRRSSLQKAANDAGYTIRSLAEKLQDEQFEATHALLIQAHAGRRRIREDLARRIEKLTGLPATRKSWPKGWV